MIGVVSAAGYMERDTYSTKGQVRKVRRERNLDHWDSDTLAYYLDEYPGYDMAVLFYAQWDSHSRTLAPYWGKIAEKMDAGTSNSNLIMALFDCELNTIHMELCQAAGITHYPTMMFIGSGPYYDTDPITRTMFGKTAAGVLGNAPIPNTVKFQGNWQYTDSIEDWIRTMQALSNWHNWSTTGLGKKLRTFFLPQGIKNIALPIGIPGRVGGGSGGSSSTGGSTTTNPSSSDSFSSTASSKEVEGLKAQLEKAQDSVGEMKKSISRSSDFLDAILVNGKNASDMYTVLDQQKAWTSATNTNNMTTKVLLTCVQELSLDYCQRFTTGLANIFVDDMMSTGKTAQEILAMENLEDLLMERVKQEEPYCALLDKCIVSDFAEESCRPNKCPFTNIGACQYLTSCTNPSLQKEYADLLTAKEGSGGGTNKNQKTTNDNKAKSTTTTTTDSKKTEPTAPGGKATETKSTNAEPEKKKKKAWGF